MHQGNESREKQFLHNLSKVERSTWILGSIHSPEVRNCPVRENSMALTQPKWLTRSRLYRFFAIERRSRKSFDWKSLDKQKPDCRLCKWWIIGLMLFAIVLGHLFLLLTQYTNCLDSRIFSSTNCCVLRALTPIICHLKSFDFLTAKIQRRTFVNGDFSRFFVFLFSSSAATISSSCESFSVWGCSRRALVFFQPL